MNDKNLIPLSNWAIENNVSFTAAANLVRRQKMTKTSLGDQILVSKVEMDDALSLDVARSRKVAETNRRKNQEMRAKQIQDKTKAKKFDLIVEILMKTASGQLANALKQADEIIKEEAEINQKRSLSHD
jgi:hypothetical protein